MKKVGIIIRNFMESNKEFVGCKKRLIDVFLAYDVELLIIPIILPFNHVINLVSMCDGVVIGGGDKYFDEDISLIYYLYQKNIPTLGICLGMQIMGIAFRGIEIKTTYHDKKHLVNIYPSSLLYKITNKKRCFVISRHHSAIKDTLLDIGAISTDGIIEEIEDKSKKFFVGVQWHPEDNKKGDLIIDAFIKSLY